MRKLFESEKRTILALGRKEWNVDLSMDFRVIAEDHFEGLGGKPPLFNLDFRMDFAEDTSPEGFLYTAECALPNAIGGADVFLAVHPDCRTPLSLHLILGHAFPLRFFKKYVKQVERVLQSGDVSAALDANDLDAKLCRRTMRVKNSLCCRLFVINDDICFLLHMLDEGPEMSGRRVTLLSDESLGEVCCYADAGQVAIIDGWMKVQSS